MNPPGPLVIPGGLIKHHTMMQMGDVKLQPETRMCFARKENHRLEFDI